MTTYTNPDRLQANINHVTDTIYEYYLANGLSGSNITYLTNDPNVANLFITDSRNSVTYNYRISQLAPDGSSIHIKGNLNAVIKSTAITDNSSSQSVTYSLYLKDRAGNQSNTITTTAITVTK